MKRDWNVNKISNFGKSGSNENIVGYQHSRTEAQNISSANLVLIELVPGERVELDKLCFLHPSSWPKYPLFPWEQKHVWDTDKELGLLVIIWDSLALKSVL